MIRISSLKKYSILVALIALACQSPGKGSTAYVGAAVFDGTGRVINDAIILEQDGHIVALGSRDSVKIPRGATTVQLDGRWVIPGLIDGHAHADEGTVARYLSYGVTSIRHVGGNLERLTSLQSRIAADSLAGPRLYIAGETIVGPPAVWPGQTVLTTPAEADAAVARLAAAHVSQIKLYTHTTREIMEAVVRAANARNIPVTAHLGYVDALTAAKLGVNALEHLSGVVEATVADPKPYYKAHEQFPNGWMTFLRGWSKLDSAALDRTATELATTGVTLVPTLIQSESYARVLDSTYAGTIDLSSIPAAEREEWNLPDLVRRYAITPADLPVLAASRQAEDLFLRRFLAHGGKVVAGSDSPNQLLAPGASLLEELRLLVRAGMSPAEALHSATQGAATLLRADSIGVLKSGAVADFVVLSASPLDDIANTRKIESIVARGKRHEPAELRRPR